MVSTPPLFPGRFQSTRPVRGGTFLEALRHGGRAISIHPPRAGRDPLYLLRQADRDDFNPPAPCGAGPLVEVGFFGVGLDFNPPAPCGAGPSFPAASKAANIFQSTRPVRGGTRLDRSLRPTVLISIHPPRAGRDRRHRQRQGGYVDISIHPPRAGRDPY